MNPYSVKSAEIVGNEIKLTYNNGTEAFVTMPNLVELINGPENMTIVSCSK